MTPTTPAGQRRRTGQEGFSLVELAIVLIIIGLIVGGVLKGQDLIESARVNSIQTQLNEIRVATSTFLNKYDDLPGDIQSTKAGLVSSETGFTSTGDGNGQIGTPSTNRLDGTTADENTWYWHHLRAAGLLGGITVPATAGTLTSRQGLQSRIGGVYTISYNGVNLPSTASPSAGHWIRLGTANGDADAATNNNAAVLTPNQLRGIDAKSDDGRPNTGNIGGAGSGTACAQGTAATSDYNVAAPNATACWAHFKL